MILYEFQIKITRQDGTYCIRTWRTNANSKLNAAVNLGRMYSNHNTSLEVEVLTCTVIQ